MERTEPAGIELWNSSLLKAREGLAEHEFAMWFKLTFIGSEGDTITAGLPTAFQKDQFLRKYRQYMTDCLCAVYGRALRLDVVVGSGNGTPAQGAAAIPAEPESRPTPGGELSDSMQVPEPGSGSGSGSGTRASASVSVSSRRSAQPDRHPMLRQDYRFENYVVGEHNKFAVHAAEAVARTKGKVYNPLLIYGGVGLGKTHLMHSVGNHVFAARPGERIICITAEAFTNEFIQMVHDRSTQAEFKNKYRSVDYLLIDDINFLEKKPGSQEELFHTFNALYDADKQMIFTCDRPVSELKNLTDRLRSRFERGLNVDLQPPEYETRCAILKSKSLSRRAAVSDEVIEIIAKNVATNVRDLEAALNKLTAYADLVKQEITPQIALKQLKDMFSKFRHVNITVDGIMRTVADHFKLTFADLKGKKRSKNIAFPRQVAMYIIREITEYSTTEIGMEFGGRDHTTVMHSCQRIEERLKLDPNFEATLQGLIRTAKEYGVDA